MYYLIRNPVVKLLWNSQFARDCRYKKEIKMEDDIDLLKNNLRWHSLAKNATMNAVSCTKEIIFERKISFKDFF